MAPSGRRLFATAAVALAAVLTAAPAQAHPNGDPQTIAVAAAEGRPEVVQVRWKVGGPDDLTLLGVRLGILPEDRVMMDGAVFYRAADAAAIGPAQQFRDYLLQRIEVTAGGRPCPGTVEPIANLAFEGATVDFRCAAPVVKAVVESRMLTDLNPAYQTVATGPGGQRVVYGPGAESHEWALRQEQKTNTAVRLSAAGGVLLVAAGAVLVPLRRKRSKGEAAS